MRFKIASPRSGSTSGSSCFLGAFAMPIHPILSLHDKPNIRLDPNAMIERPEVAAWIGQCIAIWSWVESNIGHMFVNLLGTNLTTGAELYAGMTSSLAKDR